SDLVWPAVVIFGAIGTIEIAPIRDVQAALQGFAVEETLTRFQDVIAGKFATDFVEELHAVDRKDSVYGLVTRDAIHSELSCSYVQTPARTRSVRFPAPLEPPAFRARSEPP